MINIDNKANLNSPKNTNYTINGQEKTLLIFDKPKF